MVKFPLIAGFFFVLGALMGAWTGITLEFSRLSCLFLVFYYASGFGTAGVAVAFLLFIARPGKRSYFKKGSALAAACAVTGGTVVIYAWTQRIYHLYNHSGLISRTEAAGVIPVILIVSLLVSVTLFFLLLFLKKLLLERRYGTVALVVLAAAAPALVPVVLRGVPIKAGDQFSSDIINSYNGRKVMLLGLDGADWKLLDPFIEKGELPNLERMLEKGVRSDLISQYMFSPQSWTSIATGCYRDKHGIHDFHVMEFPDGNRRALQDLSLDEYILKVIDRISETARIASERLGGRIGKTLMIFPRIVNDMLLFPMIGSLIEDKEPMEDGKRVLTGFQDVKMPMLWEFFQSAGEKTGLVNWLFSLPEADGQGWVISGAASIGRVPEGSVPDYLGDELDRFCEGHRTAWLGNDLIPCTDFSLALNPDISSNENDYELDMVSARGFGEAEAARTGIPYLWNRFPEMKFLGWPLYFTDGLGHRFCNLSERNGHSRYSDVYLECLKRVDLLIGELMQMENMTICIVSDHGMEKVPDSELLPLNWQGFRIYLEPLLERVSTCIQKDAPLPRIVSIGPHDFGLAFEEKNRETLLSWLDSLESVKIIYSSGREEKLFRSLRRGRVGEPDIVIDRFANFRFCELESSEDWAIVTESFKLPASDVFQDLGIRCLHGSPSPESEKKLGRNGIFILYGPDVSAGKGIDPLRTVDVAPTILYASGLPVPETMDGSPAFKCFSEDFAKFSPVRYTSSYPIKAWNSGTGGQIDDQRVDEALRALGYIQ